MDILKTILTFILSVLHNKGIVTKIYDGTILNTSAAYSEMLFFYEKMKKLYKSDMG